MLVENTVCSAHAEMIPIDLYSDTAWIGLLRTRGDDPNGNVTT